MYIESRGCASDKGGMGSTKLRFTEAQDTYKALGALNQPLGYKLIHLPLAPVEERATFVVDVIGNTAAAAPR